MPHAGHYYQPTHYHDYRQHQRPEIALSELVCYYRAMLLTNDDRNAVTGPREAPPSTPEYCLYSYGTTVAFLINLTYLVFISYQFVRKSVAFPEGSQLGKATESYGMRHFFVFSRVLHPQLMAAAWPSDVEAASLARRSLVYTLPNLLT